MRLDFDKAMELYNTRDMNHLSKLATNAREEINGKTVWYNKNFHLEPSNVQETVMMIKSQNYQPVYKDWLWQGSISK